jgi:malate dehydrogenase (quinone)
VVHAADGSIAALLGASPGASTAVAIMLGLIKKCFPERAASAAWIKKITEMIPSYGKNLGDDEALLKKIRSETHQQLGLALI